MAAPLYLHIKPVSGECGLHCRYCFYRDIARSREVPSYGQMTEDTARTLIAKAMAYGRSAYVFAFQGGEPTLRGLDFYRRIAGEYQNFLAPGGTLMLEIGYDEAESVRALFGGGNVLRDLGGRDRVVVIQE